MHLGEVKRKLLGDLDGRIGRTVVDEHDFEVGCEFRHNLEKFVDQTGQARLRIADRHDDREGRIQNGFPTLGRPCQIDPRREILK